MENQALINFSRIITFLALGFLTYTLINLGLDLESLGNNIVFQSLRTLNTLFFQLGALISTPLNNEFGTAILGTITHIGIPVTLIIIFVLQDSWFFQIVSGWILGVTFFDIGFLLLDINKQYLNPKKNTCLGHLSIGACVLFVIWNLMLGIFPSQGIY